VRGGQLSLCGYWSSRTTEVASFIRKGLEEEGHAVEVAADGDEALERAADGSAWDLVVLDVMLPKRDGFSV